MTFVGEEADDPVRLLLLLSSESYRAEAFLTAAERLGIAVTVGSDHRQALSDTTGGTAVEVDFADVDGSVRRIEKHHLHTPIRAIVAAEDDGAILAARAAERLGLRHNDPDAVLAARRKDLTRARLRRAGLPTPRFRTLPIEGDPRRIARELGLPCVVKPLALSASRGVIRADTPEELADALRRVARLLADDTATASPLPHTANRILIEEYIPGEEVALEGILEDGRLRTLAILDKPDPLEGPYFEETLFVTPSRHPADTRREIIRCAGAAAGALGLREGPIHAELRVNERGVWPVEVAPRSIGGLCSRLFQFWTGRSLEELILAQALGRDLAPGRPRGAAGVMMIPIPRAGTLGNVLGIEEAERVPGILEIVISIPRGGTLVPLPEGRRYLGFIFAAGETPEEVEAALRAAHGHLTIELVSGGPSPAPSR